MWRFFYSILGCIALLLALIKLLWRGRKNRAYWHGWSERFGWVKKTDTRDVIWIHAVSVGETNAIVPLVKALLKDLPGMTLYFTNGTVTGKARSIALFGDTVLHSYAPYDLPFFIHPFLSRVKPTLVLLMETEVWPCWMAALKQRNIPTVLVNARLSQKSCRGYARFSGLFRPAWESFTAVISQAKADANRYHYLGVPKARITVSRNLKYNLVIPEDLADKQAKWQAILPNAPVWITASTHDGEEQILLEVYQQLKKIVPTLLWILVPRHIDRADKIMKLCEQAGFNPVKRSAVDLASQSITIPTEARVQIIKDILLVDTIGELLLFYRLAQVAFVGGSLIPRGGHNILEAAALDTAITTGPWMFNFAEITKTFERFHAMKKCDTQEVLFQETLQLLSDQTARTSMLERAKTCFLQHQTGLETHMHIIKAILGA